MALAFRFFSLICAAAAMAGFMLGHALCGSVLAIVALVYAGSALKLEGRL